MSRKPTVLIWVLVICMFSINPVFALDDEDKGWLESKLETLNLKFRHFGKAWDSLNNQKAYGGRRDLPASPDVLPSGRVLLDGKPLLMVVEEEFGEVQSFSISGGAFSSDSLSNTFTVPASSMRDGEKYEWSLKTTKGTYYGDFKTISGNKKKKALKQLAEIEAMAIDKDLKVMLRATSLFQNKLRFNAKSEIAGIK